MNDNNREGSTQKSGISDEELNNICKNMTRSIKLIGCGPAGCSFINECVKWNMHGLDIYALGSDIHQLNHIRSPNKMLLRPATTHRLNENPRSLLQEGFQKEDEIAIIENSSKNIFIRFIFKRTTRHIHSCLSQNYTNP